MQAGRGAAAQPPIGIAFEGDLATRIDAVLAIAMLNGFTAANDARNISLSISRPSLKTAQLAEVVASFYAGRAVGGYAMIGVPDGTPPPGDNPLVAAMLLKTAADGTPAYSTNLTRLLDTPDDAVLIRNRLLAQNDANARVVLAGPATGLARLLALYGAPPQIQTKVDRLVVAIGSFPSGPADPAVAADVAAARTLFAEWPTPIVAVGAEIGAALPYPGASIDRDFAWSPAHPVADAYRAFKPMPYDAPAGALAATLYAVHPDDGYFTLSAPGTITVLDDGRTQFTPGADGRHRYLIADPAQKDRVIKVYEAMVSARPAPRGGRGRRPPAAAQPQPPKPADARPAEAKPGEAAPPTP
jgi:hypothetical protein